MTAVTGMIPGRCAKLYKEEHMPGGANCDRRGGSFKEIHEKWEE